MGVLQVLVSSQLVDVGFSEADWCSQSVSITKVHEVCGLAVRQTKGEGPGMTTILAVVVKPDAKTIPEAKTIEATEVPSILGCINLAAVHEVELRSLGAVALMVERSVSHAGRHGAGKSRMPANSRTRAIVRGR